MHLPAQSRSPLHEDLECLLAELGMRPSAIEAVSSPRSPRSEPGAFRVDLADGRRLKATITTGPGHASRVEYLLGCFDGETFPRVLGRRGRVLVFEWVEGEPIAADTTAELLCRAADLQVSLHQTPVPADCPYRATDLGSLREKFEGDLRSVVELGIVAEREAALAVDTARRFAPRDCAIGFVHRDLCAENLILRADGRLSPVDNETVSLGPFEFDLARTWYRWPMDGARRRLYLDAYARRRGVDALLEHFPFWAVAVLADSVQLRRSAGAPVLAQPVERLRALLGALERAVAPRDLAFES